MPEIKICPHCGGQMLMATITRPCIVEASTDSNNPYKILKEIEDKYDINIFKCARCKAEIKEEELVTGVICKECNRVVSSMDVNENGICNVCVAVKQRAELANASREDLIKMILDAEKKVNPITTKMEKQIEKANDTNINTLSADDIEAETTTDDTTIPDKPRTKRKSRKKKTEDNITEDIVDNNSEQETLKETSNEAIDNIANEQEAPFPDVISSEEISNEQSNETEINISPLPQEEHAIGADFNMFDDSEEAF